MTIEALQNFLGRHMVASGALTALGAALDAKVTGVPLDPPLAKRVQDLLDALGAGDVLVGVGEKEAAIMRGLVRGMYLLDAKMLFSQTRASMWSHVEPEILQSIGEAARVHAIEVTRALVPACEGLTERLDAPTAAMLDVGVGVAGSAIAMLEMWPKLRIVGIDPWAPSLELARENVRRANMAERIELREQGVEALEAKSAFDLVWFANPFIPERSIRLGLTRCLEALRPGGYIVSSGNNDNAPPELAALFRLRTAQWGGPVWSTTDAEAALREAGYADVRALPTKPSALSAFVVGRRPG